VNDAAADEGDFFWRPTIEGDDRLGWVVFTGVDTWVDGVVYTLEASATAMDGSELRANAEFVRDARGAKAAIDGVQVVPYRPEGVTGLFQEGLGIVVQVAPAEVYDTPQLVTIPVPDYATGRALTLYYLRNGEAGPFWYPAESVSGLLAAPVSVSEDGLEAWLNHGGTLRLGYAPERDLAAAVPMNYGTILLFAGTGLTLWVMGWRRREVR
jgi:hypothetical protein